ncbi:unnamed protein product [[Candida] boidinii]|nr:unnamed protein product [[Candida] boidinii]
MSSEEQVQSTVDDSSMDLEKQEERTEQTEQIESHEPQEESPEEPQEESHEEPQEQDQVESQEQQDEITTESNEVEEDIYDRSIKDDVIYEIKEKPEYTETRALIIANLRPPFDNKDFQDLLNTQAEQTNSTIERAWLNARRTHCIVIVSDIAGAVSIQKNLNGKIFPFTDSSNDEDQEQDQDQDTEKEQEQEQNVTEKLPLYADFIPVKATSLWIDQENRGPKDGIWKIRYITQKSKTNANSKFLVSTHKMINYPNRSDGYKSSNTSIHSSRYPRGGSTRSSSYRSSYYERPYYNNSYDNSRYYQSPEIDPVSTSKRPNGNSDYYSSASPSPSHYSKPPYYNSGPRGNAPPTSNRYSSRPFSNGRESDYPPPQSSASSSTSASSPPRYGSSRNTRIPSHEYRKYRESSSNYRQPSYNSSYSKYPSSNRGYSSYNNNRNPSSNDRDDDYRRERSPTRYSDMNRGRSSNNSNNNNNSNTYGSRSPSRSPIRNARSPEWSD